MAALLAVALALSAWSAHPGVAQTAPTLQSLKLPFAAGTAWKVLQGYNGGTHTSGPELYALDLVRDGGPTGGMDVIAPVSGSIWFAHAPGAGNGCASIKADGGGGLIVQMCHIVLHRVMHPDERIVAGASIGTVGGDGRVGNNGIAHMHLSMHRTPDFGFTRIPVPFAPGDGIPLEGRSLTPDGTRNQFACPSASCPGMLMSTNGTAPSGAMTAPAMSPGTTPLPGALPPSPSPAPAIPPATAPLPAPGTLPLLAPPPVHASAPSVATSPAGGSTVRIGGRVVVAGAGDCVNVREQATISAKAVQCLPDGARARIADGPLTADGYQWWRLDGLGWVVGTYLSPVPPSLEPGGRARVAAGRGECLNVRTAPAIVSPTTGCLADGAAVRLIDGPFVADGLTWWRIEGAGWVSGEFLTPEE